MKNYANQRFYEVILIFEELLEKDQITKFVYESKEYFYENMKTMEGEFSWIDSDNRLLQNKIAIELKIGKVFNIILREFRSKCIL